MNADEKKSKKPMSLKMQMKMIIRLFVDILKTAWEVVEIITQGTPKRQESPRCWGDSCREIFQGKL